MVKAGSLFYALILMLLIGIVLSALLISSGTNKLFISKLALENELIDFNQSSIQYGLAYFKKLDTITKIDQPFNDKFTLAIKKENWGFLDVLNCKSYFRNDTISKLAYIGSFNKNKLALYLSDFDKPLYLHNAKIKGNCKIPNGNYSTLQLSNSNIGINTIEGNISNSPKELPKLDKKVMLNLHLLDVIDYLDIEKNKLETSFYGKGKLIDMHQKVNVENVDINGKVIIKSFDSICIKKSAKLTNVIIVSPKVYVESGFKGNIQIFASKSIMIDEYVALENPSFIYLQNEQRMKEAKVTIKENSTINGGILVLGKTEDVNTNYLSISHNSTVIGTIYCKGYTELKGTVLGTVYSDKFYLDTGDSKYSNAIKDGKINILKDDFVSIDFGLQNSNNYEILKWLN